MNKKYIAGILLVFLVFISCTRTPVEYKKAEAGYLNLADHDFLGQSSIDLEGEWSFSPIGETPDGLSGRFIAVPGIWPADATTPGFAYPFGAGTLTLRINLPKEHPELVLRTELVMSSFRLAINGVIVEDFFTTNPADENRLPMNTPRYYRVPASTGRLELVFDIANYWDRYNTGFCIAPRLGTASAILDRRLQAVATEALLMGLLLLAALYHLLLFTIQKKDRALLYFALISLGILVRELSTNEAYWLSAGGMRLPLFLRLQLGSIWGICLSFIWYLGAIFPKTGVVRAHRFLTVLCLSGLVLNFLLPMHAFTALLNPIHAGMGLTILYTLFVLFRSLRTRQPLAPLMTAGGFTLIIPVLFDLYKTWGHSLEQYLTPLGLLPFICIQTYLLALRYTRALTEAEELRIRTRELGEIDRQKTRFLANISHELRTPLTLILAPIEMIRTNGYGETIPSTHKAFTLIQANALRMVRLVETLLDFSRGGENLVHKPVPHDIAEIAAVLQDAFRPLAEQKNISLDSIRLDAPREKLVAEIDLRAFETIFCNLLANAIKCTPAGGSIRVAFGLDMRQETEFILLSVEDTGCGIKPENLTSLFIRYSSLYTAERSDYRGNGIGLSLSREMALAMGGDLHAESVWQQGSVFTLALPRSMQNPVGLPTGTVQVSVEGFMPPSAGPEAVRGLQGSDGVERAEKRCRILIVEDHEELGAFIKETLDESYEADWVKLGSEAVQILESGDRPELVLCDMMLPDLDGKKILEACGRTRTGMSVPFIFISALADFSVIDDILNAGAVDYLVKPFRMEELLAKIRSHLAIRHGTARAFHHRLARFLETETQADPAGRRTFYPPELSGREVEVLEMVCDGLGDKQIADKLGISVRTASNHVASLLRKTGLSSRQSLRERFLPG